MAEDLWIVGFHAVLGVLQSPRPVDALLIQRGRRDARIHKIIEAARGRNLRWDVVDRSRLDRISSGAAHNGCAVRTAPVDFVPLDDLLRAHGEPGRLLLLDDVEDPHNLGAAVRTAAALAVDGVVVAGPSAPPLGGAVAKAAAGLLERVPIARVKVGADALSTARDAGYWVFGADADGTPVDQVKRTPRWVLCVGAEGRGLRAKTRSRVDELVAIPMAPGVESLNLSVSAGILLWELSRS
ncbi:MAG: 23S rRNA (guanosine(2251)-2'-O)-methyltransferase RlmB [Acidobacteriota bacterium]